jgi:hypothetical protein
VPGTVILRDMPMRNPASALVRSGWQDVADLLRLVIAAAGIAAMAHADAGAAIKCALLLPAAVAARLVRAPAWDVAFTFALAVEAIGSAAAFNTVDGWNTAAHLVLPFLSGPLLYCGLVRLGLRMDARASGGTAVALAVGAVTFAAVLATGALWELIEWAVDSWFGTHLAVSYHDTVLDLLHDAVAALASGLLMALWQQ